MAVCAGSRVLLGAVQTNQAVGLQHRVAKETLSLRFVSSIDHCRHIATRTDAHGWLSAEIACQYGVRTSTIKASKINPDGHHEHPEPFQDRTH